MKQMDYYIVYLLLITQYMKSKLIQRLLVHDNVNGNWQKFPTIFDMKTDIESILGLRQNKLMELKVQEIQDETKCPNFNNKNPHTSSVRFQRTVK